MKRYILAISLLILSSLACQALSGTPGGSDAPPPVFDPGNTNPVPTSDSVNSNPLSNTATVLFEDDFSNAGGWGTNTDGEASLQIVNGAFSFAVFIPQQLFWSNPGLSVDDVRIEVDATKVSGPDAAEFGVICRYTEVGNNFNFYYMVIAGDTISSIVKVVNSEQVEVSERGIEFDAVNPGNATNHITAECIGNTISLYANGVELFTETDDSIPAGGDVGLIATTFEDGGININFDNFVVTEP